MKKNIQKRTQCYQLANNFLSGIYLETANRLITAQTYSDSLSNYLHTEYIDEVFSKAAVNYDRLCRTDYAIRGIFAKDVVEPVKVVAVKAKQAHEKAKMKR